MTIAPCIQSITNTNTTITASVAATLAAAPFQGSLLVAYVCAQGTRTLTASGTWTRLALQTSGDTSALFWKVCAAGDTAAQTVCTSDSTSAAWGVCISEWHSATGWDANPVEASTSNTTSTATKTTTSALDPADSVERLMVGGANNTTGNGITWSAEKFGGSTTGVTERADLPAVVTISTNETGLCMWDAILTTGAGTYTAEAVCSAAAAGSVHMAIFKPSAQGTALAKVGTFDTGTGAAASTVAVTGVGFQPKLILFFWAGADSIGTFLKDYRPGMGACDAALHQFAVTNYGDRATAAGSANAHQLYRSDGCVATSTASVLDGYLSVTSLDADGFTLTVQDALASSVRVGYLALGGADLTNTLVGTVQIQAGTGNQDVTGFGFTPTGLLLGISQVVNVNTAATHAGIGFGLLDAAGNQVVAVNQLRDTTSPTQTDRYLFAGEAVAQAGNAVVSGRAVGSILSDGFRMAISEAPTVQGRIGYVAFSGLRCLVGTTTTTTSGTPFAVTGAPAAPIAGLLVSAGATVMTQDTPTANAVLGMGAFTDPASRWSMGDSDQDNVSTTVAGQVASVTDTLTLLTTAGVVNARMDVQSIDSGGATFVMDDTDTQSSVFGYMFFVAASLPFTSLEHDIRGLNRGLAVGVA